MLPGKTPARQVLLEEAVHQFVQRFKVNVKARELFRQALVLRACPPMDAVQHHLSSEEPNMTSTASLVGIRDGFLLAKGKSSV